MLLKYIYTSVFNSKPNQYAKFMFSNQSKSAYDQEIPFWILLFSPVAVTIAVLIGLGICGTIAGAVLKSAIATAFINWLINAYLYILVVYYFTLFTLFLVVPLFCFFVAILDGILNYLTAKENIDRVSKMFPSDLNCIVPTAIFGAFAENVHENMIEANPFVLREEPYKFFDHLVEVLDDEGDYVKYKLTGVTLLREVPGNHYKKYLENRGIHYYNHTSNSYSLKKKDFLKLYVSTGNFSNNFELTEQ